MPLYEYFCDACASSFEALVPFSASAQDVHPCPACGERARRILSSVNFMTERRTARLQAPHGRNGPPDVTTLTLPPAARLCWMDNQSAARLAAYKVGRGAEYDDTIAARNELVSRNVESEGAEPVQPVHSHSPL